MLQISILVITALLNLALGGVVYIKNPKSATNKSFLLLTSSITLWSVVNYISVHPTGFSQLVWIRLVLFFSAILNLSIFLTLFSFPNVSLSPSAHKKAKLAAYVTVLIMGWTLTPFVFNRLSIQPNGSVGPVPHPGIALFLIYTLSMLGGSIYILVKKYRAAAGALKNQLALILYGIAGTFSLIVVTNFLLVVIFNITTFVPFGPAFTLIFSSSMAYAIIRQRLFDIRAAIARSVAYLLVLISMASFYALTIFGVTALSFDNKGTTRGLQLVYTFLALVLAFTFQPIKQFFDRLTSRLFYRDLYDPQDVLDQIGTVIVGSIDSHRIQHSSLKVLAKAVQPTYMTFALYDSSGKLTQREQVGEEKLFSQIDELASALKNTSKRIVVYDELSGSNSKLHLILQNLDVSVAVPLITKDGITGYLLLGPKLSGNIYTSQDIGVLGIAASELAVALQNAQRFEEIRDFNETLQDKITGATKELRSTNKKLVELDEAKDEFISMASHQLRTPLTSIKGYISMLIEGDLGKLNEQQKTALKEAFTSSQRMVFLIADFLNVSRIKTGKFVIEPKELDLSAMVKEELIQLKEMAESKHLELKYDPPHNFPTVMLDDNKMHQVMMNIVDNAIYYTPQGGTITIQLYENDKEIIFKVIDTGIGVPKTEQHKLFTKFYRAGNARKARPDGTGLGLYMAQKIIVEQGGSMIFESIEGKGSTFGFRFPLAKIKS